MERKSSFSVPPDITEIFASVRSLSFADDHPDALQLFSRNLEHVLLLNARMNRDTVETEKAHLSQTLKNIDFGDLIPSESASRSQHQQRPDGSRLESFTELFEVLELSRSTFSERVCEVSE